MKIKPKSKILVIDDDSNVAEMLRDSLELRGYEVIIATSGPEGIQKACMFKPDVITLDLQMPGMNGFEVLEKLKSNRKTRNINVLIATVMDERKSLDKVFLLGARDYVIKPFSMENFEVMIEKIINKKEISILTSLF